jgi:hypothetical protein
MATTPSPRKRDASTEMEIDPRKIVIGQWADYFDTGIWSMRDGQMIAPEDLTIEQLKDFLIASGGAVYLAHDGRFRWVQIEWEKQK